MSSKIDVYSTAASLQEDDLRSKTVVVIDVLRATSTIITALQNGAKGIIPVQDMGDASKIAINLDSSQFLLCGEKDGKKIEGYHLGNSPLEYTKKVVNKKTLILNTTNGTKAIGRAVGANKILIGGFLNLSCVVEKLKTLTGEIIILCAGWKNRLSLEDMLCAGMIVHELNEGDLPQNARDGAKIAFALYDAFGRDIEKVVAESNHAVRLRHLVDSGDVAYCTRINEIPILPTFEDGMIKA